MHEINFSIHDGEGTLVKTSKCEECLKVFVVIGEIERKLGIGNNHAKSVLNDCTQKIRLYLGYVQRCFSQTKRIGEIMSSIRTKSPGESWVTYMDYNMKLEPIRRRESTTKFFGKRGMAWHGSGIFYLGGEPCNGERWRRSREIN